MKKLLETMGERMLGVVVPKAEAAAANCTPNSVWWGAYCFCSGGRPYYQKCKCNASGSTYTCTCTYRAGIGTC